MDIMNSIPVITTTNPKTRIGGVARETTPHVHTARVATATTEMVLSKAHYEVYDPLQPVTAVEGIKITHDHLLLLLLQCIGYRHYDGCINYYRPITVYKINLSSKSLLYKVLKTRHKESKVALTSL